MNFEPSEEQKLLIETARRFVEEEMYPYEEEVEKTGDVPAISCRPVWAINGSSICFRAFEVKKPIAWQ